MQQFSWVLPTVSIISSATFAATGFELTSMESAMTAYTKLREATSLELTVTRRGKPTTLRYAIR